jgi:hypothetical protein
MSLTLVLVLVVIFSFAIGHLLTRYAERFVMLSGGEYILVGVLIGPHFPWKLVSERALVELSPLFSLLLGLVGFVLGLRGRQRERRLDHSVVGYVTSVAVLLTVAAGTLPVLIWAFPWQTSNVDFVLQHTLVRWQGWVVELVAPSTHLWISLGVGASAAVASPLLIEQARSRPAAGGRVSSLLETVAHSSQITAVLTLGFVLASARATAQASRFSMTVTEWETAAVAVGVASGLLFGLFIGRESDRSRIFLATIGLVTFAAGIGAALGISPLFVCLLAAVTVSATSSHSARVRDELMRLQHPLFVLVMIFAGTLWVPVQGWQWAFPVGYVVVRFVTRRFWMTVGSKLFLERPLRTRRLGNGLLFQGTLAVAVAVNFAQRFPDYASVILTTVLLGVLASDLFSRRALTSVLSDAGELGELADEVPRSQSERPSSEVLS